MISSWARPARGLALLAVLIAVKNIQPLALGILVFSVYNALELWRFDRVAAVERAQERTGRAHEDKLFLNDPEIDRESLGRALASRSDEWTHTPRRVPVWNPRRAQLELFAGLNPVVAFGAWLNIYSATAALLTGAVLLGGLLKFAAALELFQQLTVESCQRQAEHTVWKHNLASRSSPPRLLTRINSKPGYLISPATSGQNSPVNTSFGSAVSVASAKSGTSGACAVRHTLLFGSPQPGKAVPRQNPRRTSSYRAVTLEVPEMAPRRVASMASRDNMRSQYQAV